MNAGYTVFKYNRADRPYYVIRWWDGPPENREGERSTKQKNKRKAEAWAADFYKRLFEVDERDRLSWERFKHEFTTKRLPNIKSKATYRSALSSAGRVLKPKRVEELDQDAFDRWGLTLVKQGKTAATAASYAKHLRAAMKWAARKKMIPAVPEIATGSTDVMRGGPIPTEAFEKLMITLPGMFPGNKERAMARVLLAAWTIGLRRSEFFACHWDREDLIHPVGIDSKTPLLVFPASCHKAKRDMRVPLLPEATDLLRSTPKRLRYGPIFLPLRGPKREITTPDGLGSFFKRLSKKAGVINGRDPESGKPRYATFHDLRKSFGERLIHEPTLTTPQVALLMRHAKIETTLSNYATVEAETVAERLAGVKPSGVVTTFSCGSGCGAKKPANHTHDPTPSKSTT